MAYSSRDAESLQGFLGISTKEEDARRDALGMTPGSRCSPLRHRVAFSGVRGGDTGWGTHRSAKHGRNLRPQDCS